VATATPLVALAELTVNEQINIRSGPGTEHSIIGTAAPGDRFLITGRNEAGDWWEVAYNGKTGWVFKELVTLFVEEGAPVPVSIGIATTMPSSTNSSTSTPHQLPTQENSLPAPVAGAVRELGGIPFVYVTAGTFQMGASPEQVDAQVALCLETTANCQRSWWENQEPQKEEYLADYWIGQTEVTNAQFRRFMNANGYGTERYWSSDGWRWRNSNNITQPRCTDDRFNADDFNSADQPAICISIYEAQAYANWFTETSGYSARIPTVAEWEKAARGADGRLFPWGDTTPTISLANINRYVGTTTPVGSYPAGMSLYGCLDMAGNVREWTTDWYTSSYDGSTGPINMGGSWLSSRNDAAIPRQSWASPDAIYTDNGFRLVCDVIGE
jgi:formylglycine-generating enzyme required for sulfatase activity